MSTPTFRFRLSPSGKYLGHPTLLLGPGSIGRTWRKHGAGSQMKIPTGTPTAITDLDAIPVNLRPGYKYNVELFYALETQGLTVAASAETFFRLRDASTSAWAAWQNMGPSHTLRGSTTNASMQSFEGDAAIGLQFVTTYDQIELGIQGDQSSGFVTLPAAAWVVITETMP